MVGLALGGSRFLSPAYERWLEYLGPTPKIILFPVMIMLFGVGGGSKIAMGAVSCFFPVAISVAAGLRGVEPGAAAWSAVRFRASRSQMLLKIALPAMAAPLVNGFRLGFGVALVGVLLAETKLSNQGIGFLDHHRLHTLRHAAHVCAAHRHRRLRRIGEHAGRQDRRPARRPSHAMTDREGTR